MIRFNPGHCGGLLLACLLGGLSGAGMVWWWLGSPLTASESGAPPASPSTARKGRCSLYVLASIFTPPDNQDLALFGS